MAKRVAILQSNYVPWKGYFDMIASVDEFIVLDDVQYTKNDWRNRNKLKTPSGPKWITVPVITADRWGQTIREAEIQPSPWAKDHWHSIEANYHRAPFFAEVADLIAPVYADPPPHISELNRRLINIVTVFLGIKTKVTDCADYDLPAGKNERVLALCQQAGAETYVSGPAAKAYLDENLFREHGIEVEWFGYKGYPEYPQLWGPFEHAVSVLDLMFNTGPNASRYFRKAA
jgi:hypothetical protein